MLTRPDPDAHGHACCEAGMSIPPVVERGLLVFFVVMQREIAVLEPHDL